MSTKVDVAAIFDAKKEIRIFRFVMFVVTLILAIYSYVAFATPRVSDKIYTELQSNHYCTRRLNSTHQVGCTSALGGNQGVVWVVKDSRDLDHILKTGPTPPYVVVLSHTHYTKDNLMLFKNNIHRVAGVIFKNDNPSAPPTPFSPDDVCPNRQWGLYSNDSINKNCQTNVWQKNSQISGILYEDIPYPIFMMNKPESLNQIDECFRKNVNLDSRTQASYPLCGIQLDSFMSAAVDAETCINSHSTVDDLLQKNGRRCEPVEHGNLFTYYKTAEGSPIEVGNKRYVAPVTDKQSIVMLVAKLSSISMFTGISPGADSTITSIITLLAVAEALGRPEIRNSTKVLESKKNLAFALFDSEPFDYLGSTAMVSTMKDNSFPSYMRAYEDKLPISMVSNTNLSSIDYIINLDQLAPHNEDQKIYLHSNPQDSNKDKVDKIAQILGDKAKQVQYVVNHDDQLVLPPTSVHQFVRESLSLPQESRLTGIVISNYDKTYTNQFYHSIHDDALGVGLSLTETRLVNHLKQVATITARTMYQIAFEDKTDVEANGDIITELLECYLKDANCNLFNRVMPLGQKPITGPVQTSWAGTKQSDDFGLIVAHNLLSYFLGDKFTHFNMSQCMDENHNSTVYNYNFINNQDKPSPDGKPAEGLCLRSQVFASEIRNPAYVIREDGSGYTINKQYPVWTKSFDEIQNPVRVFMIPSPLYRYGLFIFGLITTVISFFIVNHLKFAIVHQDSFQPQPTST